MAGDFKRDDIVFHENASVAGIGNIYLSNDSGTELNIEFISNGTFTAYIEVKLLNKSSKWYPYPVVKMSASPEIAPSPITDASCIYNIDTNTISAVRVNIVAITGTLSVYGVEVG